MSGYRELGVWKKSMQLAKEIYMVVKKLPKEEMYSMSDQMRRAAVSIPSNIAEGRGRTSDKQFAYFLTIAQGSRAELETQLQLCVDVGMLKNDDITEAMDLLEEVGKMMSMLIRQVRKSW